jgi:hypothetical protein
LEGLSGLSTSAFAPHFPVSTLQFACYFPAASCNLLTVGTTLQEVYEHDHPIDYR